MADRRAFIGSVAAGFLASPVSTFAQQPAKIPRIGVLANSEGAAWDGFRQGLRELGYVDGHRPCPALEKTCPQDRAALFVGRPPEH